MAEERREIQIEKTADGSHTLYIPEMDEHYHSVKGAWTESDHVFVQTGFRQTKATHPHLLEIGFGTGLNAFLTLMEAERMEREVHYTALELYPLPIHTIQHLGYPEGKCPDKAAYFRQLHSCEWGQPCRISPFFVVEKLEADFTTYGFREMQYDVIYFDAFAPEKQPEMWEQELFNRLYLSLRPGGVLTTYCAKGVVRRMLKAAGFTVERLPGPPGGKREILRAGKPITPNESIS